MGRKKKGAPELSATAAELLTRAGYLNASADLYTSLASGGLRRDEVTALIGARRCLEPFEKERARDEEQAKHDELLAELEKTREALRRRGTGGQTSFDGDPLQAPDGPGGEPTQH